MRIGISSRGLLGFVSVFILSLPLQAREVQHENFEFDLTGGTGAPCPTPDQYSAERPEPAGVATRVGGSRYFEDIFEIRDTEQTFTADVWLVLRWRDARLADASRGTPGVNANFRSTRFRSPKVQFENLREVEQHYDEIALVDAEGYILFFRRMLLTVFSPLDLRDFPFDRQVLELAVDSIWGNDEVVFEVLREFEGQKQESSVTSWLLGAPKAGVEDVCDEITKTSHASFICQIEAKREPGFFTRKLIIPLTLIVFMARAIFLD